MLFIRLCFDFRLTPELVAHILKIAVRESCVLLRQCQTTDKINFTQILSSVPVSDLLAFIFIAVAELLSIAEIFKA